MSAVPWRRLAPRGGVRSILIGLILMGITLWGCAVQANDLDLPEVSLVEAATVAEMPSPALGEVREFVGPVATINCSRWEIIEANDEEELISQCEQYKIYFKRSEHLNLHKITANDALVLEFTPVYPGIEFPLAVGKQWRKRYEGYSVIEGVAWKGDVTCDVADFAQIQVAAGTFKAFRIECRDRWKVGDAESSVNSTAWYAPKIEGVVKSVNYEDPRWNTELKAYSR